jgi:mercuric ion transport protein
MTQEKHGFLAAVLASSCCVLPLLLLTVGLGGSVLTMVLMQYKAYLMTLALAALVYAWVQYARDAKRCTTQACALVGGRFRRWMLGVNTSVVVLFFFMTYTPVSSLANVVLQGSLDAAQVTSGLVQPPASERPGPAPLARASGESGETTRREQLTLRVDGMT